MSEKLTGSCLCGGVSFAVEGDLRDVIGCHCVQCRKTSGHFVAATRTRTADLRMTSEVTLKWFQSSVEAERGFCNQCGGNVFWRRIDSLYVSIMAGTLDEPVNLTLNRHIFVKNKGNYYELPNDIDCYAESD